MTHRPDDQRCKDCEFSTFDEEQPDLISVDCRRRSIPNPVVNKWGKVLNKWPQVEPAMWCGEFEPRNGEAKRIVKSCSKCKWADDGEPCVLHSSPCYYCIHRCGVGGVNDNFNQWYPDAP